MSAGKDAYELRKQQKKDLKMQQEQTRADRDRREAKADELAELAMDALKAFLTGNAFLDITPGPNVGNVVHFRFEPKPSVGSDNA